MSEGIYYHDDVRFKKLIKIFNRMGKELRMQRERIFQTINSFSSSLHFTRYMCEINKH